MNAQQALELITPIPADDFIAGNFTDYKGKCCFIGHLQRLTSNNPNDYSRQNCKDIDEDYEYVNPMRKLSKKFMRKEHGLIWDIVSVNNDANVNGYTEPVIKDRLVHCLTDMIAAGY